MAWWTGFPKSQVRNILKTLEDDVAYIDISDLGKTMLMLSKDKAQLERAAEKGKPVISLLPSLDPYLMGYKDRERYVDAEHYDFIFDRGGNATSTILVDGKVIGVWDFEEPVTKIFLFEESNEDLLREIHSKARSLGAFISGKQVVTKECRSMTPLTLRTAGGVMSPLKLS